MKINIVKQTRHYRKSIAYLLLIMVTILMFSWGISRLYALPLSWLMTDPPALFKTNQFIGFTTFMGVVVLSAGLGAEILMTVVRHAHIENRETQFLFGLALITLFLILDDLFMFHERIFTGWLHVGERTIFSIYIFLFLAFIFIYRKQVFAEPIILFAISGVFLFISLFADVLTDKFYFPHQLMQIVNVIEEGGKMGGYLFWTAYLVDRSKAAILSVLASETNKP